MSIIKVKVQLYDESGEGGPTGPIYEYDFNCTLPLGEHLYTICSMYSLPEGMYSLQVADTGAYLFEEIEERLGVVVR